MAYCFIATTSQKTDWQSLKTEIFQPDSAIEMFPVASENPDVPYLAISIPLSKLEKYPHTWNTLVEIINKLKSDYSFEVFDLYNGFFVTSDNLDQVKKALSR